MYIRPKIVEIKPESVVRLRTGQIKILGDDFQQGPPGPAFPSVFLGTVSLTVSSVQAHEILAVIPDTIDEDTYDVVVANPNGRRSNIFPFKVYSEKLARDGYQQKIVDQRVQPLPPPFNIRDDVQRIKAGSQFTGTLPDADVGVWGTIVGPSQGGHWRYAEDVVVRQIVFNTNGAEAIGRLAGSGFYYYPRTGVPILIFDLATAATATKKEIFIPEEDLRVYLKHGEELRLVTVGATREMLATVTVEVKRQYL